MFYLLSTRGDVMRKPMETFATTMRRYGVGKYRIDSKQTSEGVGKVWLQVGGFFVQG